MGSDPTGAPPPLPLPVAPPAPLSYAQSMQQARLHPLTLAFAGWNAVRGFLLPALAVLVLRRDVRGLGWVPLAATFGAVAVGFAMLKYFTFSYWITGGELVVRSGILAKMERHIPLARVQDVRLKQALPHRLLGVVEVQIETAGGQGAEAKLSVLSQAEAARLRDAIFAQRVELAQASELTQPATAAAAPAPVPERRTLRRVTLRDLVLAGLTSNQVASGFAVVLGLVAFVDRLLDPADYGPRVARAAQAFEKWVSAGGPATLALVVVGGIVLLLVLGLFISVGGSIVLFYGFELSLASEDLYRSYGLFTRHATSLPRRRIQVLRIEEGFLRRTLGLATLRVNSAGSKVTDNEDEKGNDVLLPVVPREQIATLLPTIFPDAAGRDHPDWRRVSRRAIWRAMIKDSALILSLTVVAVLINGRVGLVALALLLPAYVLNLLAYRNIGYARDAAFFRTRRGWLSRSTHIVPVRNVQAIVIRQNPLDRRHGVATVFVDTAGQVAAASGPKVANVPWPEANALAAVLARQAAAERYRW